MICWLTWAKRGSDARSHFFQATKLRKVRDDATDLYVSRSLWHFVAQSNALIQMAQVRIIFGNYL
jgi:hypothetical protein